MAILSSGFITITDFNDITSSPTAPTSPAIDQVWLDTSTEPPVLKTWNGSSWVETNGVTIGGRNILRNTALYGDSYFTFVDGTGIDTGMKNGSNNSIKYKISNADSTMKIGATPTPQPVVFGESYSASAEIYLPATHGMKEYDFVALELQCFNALGGLVTSYMVYGDKKTVGKWTKLKLENQTIPVGTVEATARVIVQGSATLWVSNLQLERGSKVSDWTPSPEDITEEIENVREKAEEAEKNALQGIEDAREANKQLNDMASDNILTPIEKQQISRTWEEIKVEKPSVNKQAQTYNISAANYDTVYNALSTYVGTLGLDVATNTNIAPVTFNAKFNDYYTERQLILNKVAEEAKKQSQDYTDSALDGVVVGGRNFLKYSDFSKDLVKSLISTRGNIHSVSIDTSTKYMNKNTLKVVSSSSNTGSDQDIIWTSVLGGSQGTGAGRNLLFSFYAKASSPVKLRARLGYGGVYQDENTVNITTSWERYVIDVSKLGDNNVSGQVIFHLMSASTVWMTMAQLEDGTKATDWTKAIEDYDDDMLEILSKAEEAEKNAQEGLAQANSAQTKLNEMASDSKLTSLEKQQVSRDWEEIKVEKDSIIKQANVYGVSTTGYLNAYNTLNTYISGLSLSSSITTNINKDTFNSTFNSYYVQRQNILDTIATKTKEYTNSVVEGVVIGGTNLLTDSTGNLGSFSVANVVNGYMNNKAYRVRRTTTGNSARQQIQKDVVLPSVKQGDTYTLSGWIYIDSDVALNQDNNQLYLRCYHTNGSTFSDICVNNIPKSSPVGQWFKVEATSKLTTSDINPNNCKVSMAVADAGSIRFSMIKLERGTKATDWTPAIQDLENAYSVFLSNEAQVIPTFNDRLPMSSKTYTTEVSVYQGRTTRTDFTIGTINSASGIAVSKSGNIITFAVSQSTALTADDGTFIVPITIDGKTFNKVFSWACSKQGESGTNAEVVTLSGEQVFKYTNNFTGAPTPSSIKIQAQVQGFSSPKYVWEFRRAGEDTWSTITSATNGNQSYYTLPHDNSTIFNSSSVKSVTIRCTVGNKYDELTVVKVSDGASGEQGVGVSSIKEQYYHSTSQTTLTGGSWSDTAPTPESGKYVWTRSVITYTNNNTTTTSPVCVTGRDGHDGVDGNDGADGSDGVSITSVDVEYAKSSSATTAPTSGWTTTSPTWESGKYIWSRTVTKYSNGKTTTTNPACITGQKGDTGAQGAQGIQGVKGENGLTTYFHVRYSANANGNPMTTTPTDTTKYMGVASTTSQTAPSSNTSYTWSKIKGEDGERGIQGVQGSDGRTSYLHIKYSNDGKTFTANNGETVGTYIGTYVDFTEADSNTFGDYTWKKYVGEDGTDGVDGDDAYTVILTNETHTFQTENDGSIATAVSTTSNVIAYKGAASVTPTFGTITNPSGMTITKSGTKLTFQANTGSSLAENGSVTIPVIVDGKTFNKIFSWSKARKGQNAKIADILASSQVFKSTDGGITFSPDNITLTPQLQNCSYSSWQYCTNYSSSGTPTWVNVVSGQNGLTISNGVLTVSKTSSLFTDSITSITFKLNTNASGVSDTLTVSKLYDVTDLEVGTRNLLARTANKVSVTGTNSANQCTSIYEFVNKSAHYAGLAGEEVTTGFTFSVSQGATGTFKIQTNGMIQGSLGETAGQWLTMSPTINVASNTGGTVTHTVTVPTDETKGFTGLQIRMDNFVGSITVSEMIIVKGNRVTGWSPAPEDIMADVESAKNVAESAQSTANSAKTEVQNVTTKLNEIASDSKLTASEKQQVLRDWEEIKLEKSSIINQANVYSISTTNFISVYNALETYVGTLNLSSSTTTTITPSEFNAKFNAYYTQRQAILDSVATKTKEHADKLTNDLKKEVDTTLNGLQTQVDGKVETWAQSSDPATAWTTTELKTAHTGDIWYNTSTKVTHRYSGTGWVKLADGDAESAKNLATSKKRVFTSTPTTPYEVGDLWVTNLSGTGDLKICKTARASGSYTASDWGKAMDYTTSTEAGNIAQDKVNGQTQADIFNKLTNNGATQGIFLDGGKVWINGEYIKAKSITADRLAIGDFTNYAQLNDDTATKYGFTLGSAEANGKWFVKGTLTRDAYISDYYTCNGGEAFRLKGDISTTIMGASTNGGTDSSYRGVAIGIVAYDGTGKAIHYLYSDRATNETKTVSSSVILPAASRKFRVFIQCEGWTPFSGTLKVRNIQVTKMAGGELIVDGSITATKIASKTITADKLHADVLSANSIVSIINGGSTTINGSKITTGTIVADQITSGTFKGTNFVAGGSTNGNGYISVLNTSNDALFRADKEGLYAKNIVFATSPDYNPKMDGYYWADGYGFHGESGYDDGTLSSWSQEIHASIDGVRVEKSGEYQVNTGVATLEPHQLVLSDTYSTQTSVVTPSEITTGTLTTRGNVESKGFINSAGNITSRGGIFGTTFIQHAANYGTPLEVGRYIDLHNAGSTNDVDVRLDTGGTRDRLRISGGGDLSRYVEIGMNSNGSFLRDSPSGKVLQMRTDRLTYDGATVPHNWRQSFTPFLFADTGSFATSSAVGQAVYLGDLVFVQGRVIASKGSHSGGVAIGGLPVSNSWNYPPVTIGFFGGVTSAMNSLTYGINGYVESGAGHIVLNFTLRNSGWQQLKCDHLGTGNVDVSFSAIYRWR